MSSACLALMASLAILGPEVDTPSVAHGTATFVVEAQGAEPSLVDSPLFPPAPGPDSGAPLPLAPMLSGFADPVPAEGEPLYFYRGLDYGSEALVSPFRLIINGGFGILQFDSRSNQLSDLDFANGWRNVIDNLAHPDRAIGQRGWWDFLQREIIPISFNTGRAQYWPNYTLHLIGGGMSYRMMLEWFRLHGYSRPNIWATGTVGVYHLLNEVVENDRYSGPNTDPVADLYIFDPLSIVLFSSEGVNRFFSHTLHMADWSYQPAVDLDHGTIENQGQNFVLKWHLPRTQRWSVFYFFGTHGHGGLSYRWGDGHAFSVAGGMRAREQVDVGDDLRTVKLVGSYGLFYDRNNSLLASVLWAATSRYKFRLNLYPGSLRWGRFAPGLFVNLNRGTSDMILGVDLRLLPGVPVGLAHRP
jgi:hypothetical protein